MMNNTTIAQAKNQFNMNMTGILDIDMMERHMKEFVELCLHDMFDTNNKIIHGETEIIMAVNDDTIKITHNCTSVLLYHYGRGNVYVMPEKHYGTFRNTFGDFPDEEYVDEVINTLITMLLENHFLYMM